MKKQHLALFTAVLLASVSLAGCGSPETSTSTDSGTSGLSSASEAGSSGEIAAEEDAEIDLLTAKYADIEGKFEHKPVSLPLCENTETLTVFTSMNTSLSSMIADYNEVPYFQQLEEMTNVHIEWQCPAVGNEATAYSLMLNSGTLPDIMVKPSAAVGYPDGLDASVDDGYFLDLTSSLQEFMPNYLAVLASRSDYYNCGRTDSGRFVGAYQLMIESQGTFAGYYVREDWLNELGLEMPVTYADWENMLVTFKEEKGCSAPMLLPNNGYDPLADSLSRGYGVTYGMMLQDGKVVYGPYEEGWKEYVTMLHDWYTKGLIDPDYMSNSTWIPDSNLVTSGATGCFMGLYTMIAGYEQQSSDENCLITAIRAPKINESDKDTIGGIRMVLGGYATISADSNKQELAMKWIDYHFSEEGFIFDNYGVENDTFVYDENGAPKFTDKIVNNEDGLTFAQSMAYYTMHSAAIVWQDWTRELASVPEKDVKCYDIWDGDCTTDQRIASSMIQMTTEESSEYSGIMADIESLRDEKTNQFITGVADIDTEYDLYLDQMKQLGIERACALYEEAYNRYLEK